MTLPFSLPQASLAAAILASTAGTYLALPPPNPSTKSAPATGDTIRLFLTHKHATKIAVAPLGLLALHVSALAYFHPAIPASILRHGADNSLNTNLITWSAATAIPLVMNLCIGIPLRLAAYTSLGKNFTFTLAKPDGLKTTGLYRYVQHPSYTGIVLIAFCNLALLCRPDGVLRCWPSAQWLGVFDALYWAVVPFVGVPTVLFVLWTRVSEEEDMLRAEFGGEWERWHGRTARFLPWVF